MRICDFFTLADFSLSEQKDLNQKLKKVVNLSNARFTSLSGLGEGVDKSIHMGPIPTFRIGPLVTLRKLHDDISPMELDWQWSLGDLEVF